MAANILLHLKHKIESLLFSAARKLSIAEIKKHTRGSEEDIIRCLEEYKKELEDRGSSIVLENDGEYWQLTVREQYVPVIEKVVTKTEMPKSIVETLAVVAYKAPVMQSNIIKIRTNKAYKHLEELEEKKFITREKKGRSKLIRLTPKFYDYFNLDPRQIKQIFKKSSKDIKTYGEKDKISKDINNALKEAQKLGELKTYGDKTFNEKHLKDEKFKKGKETSQEKNKEEDKGLKITPEQEKKVEKRIRELMGMTSENEEQEQKNPENNKK